jgi:hypothetical protein
MTGSALAVDLRNEDNVAYPIKVVEGTNVIEVSVKPNSIEPSICQTACAIELQGEVIGAVGETVVTIQKGKLHGQSQLCPKQVCTNQECKTEYYTAESCPVEPRR